MADREMREGSLEAPTRHPLGWKEAGFWDAAALEHELERVYDICHGCRRCVSLCNAFPTLFDLVDESATMEVDGVAKADYQKVVDQCYLCDLCYMTKCPYVPPHEWNVDFPHLMLRAKAVHFKAHGASLRDRVLTSTDAVGKLASIPVVAEVVNTTNRLGPARKLMESTLGVHAEAPLPRFHSNTLRKRVAQRPAARTTTDRIGLFVTCYGNRNAPQVVEDMIAVFEHNGVAVELVAQEHMLRHAEARARRPGNGRETQECQHPAAGRTRRARIAHHRADPELCADVPPGTATHVPGRSSRRAGAGGDGRPPSSS